MLSNLYIHNFTIIDKLDLELHAGMTVLTGETGAGKSILIDALLLALGGRAESSMVKQGAERCTISAAFAIEELPLAQQWLIEHELGNGDECILRRVINADGRSKGFINSQPVPLQMLRELSNLLISIHGQHEHQTLLKPDKQRALLDAYAGNSVLLKKVQTLYHRWRKTQDELTQLKTQSEQRLARYDLIKYQVQELDKLDLQKDEIKHLDQEQRQLANADQLLSTCQNTINLLTDDEEVNATRLLNTIHSQLLSLKNYDKKFNEIAELINNAIIQVEEASNEIQDYLNLIELNPERLQWVEQRLSSIYDMARKHRITPEELADLYHRLTIELQQLETSDERIQQLQQELVQLSTDYQTVALELTKCRQQAAKRLAPLVEKSIRELGMPGGKFNIHFESLTQNEFTNFGLERIEFYVSANPGQPLQPLAKVASGGELSRISLAIHVLTAKSEATPTLIFDEVDVGIGGGTAEIVGRLLRTLAKSTQVLCVTHLPQVAAQGHHHLQIGKTTANKTTATKVQVLDKNAKVQEIARMLGGVKITEQTLAHAKEMLEAV